MTDVALIAAPTRRRWPAGPYLLVLVALALLAVAMVSVADVGSGERAVLSCGQDRCTLRRGRAFGGLHTIGSYPRSEFVSFDEQCRTTTSYGEDGATTSETCRPALIVTGWVPARSGPGDFVPQFERRTALKLVNGKLVDVPDATVVPIMAHGHSWKGPENTAFWLHRPGTYTMEARIMPWPLWASTVVAALLAAGVVWYSVWLWRLGAKNKPMSDV